MLEMRWIAAILQLHSQVTVLFGNVIIKRENIRRFDLLALFHYLIESPSYLSPFNIITEHLNVILQYFSSSLSTNLTCNQGHLIIL